MITLMNYEGAGYKKIFVDDESWAVFQQLVNRGAGLWIDAPAEIKKFADEVTSGKARQDYKDDTPRPYKWYHKCSCGYVTAVKTLENTPPDYKINCANTELPIRYSLSDGTIVEKTLPCKRLEPFNQAPQPGVKEA